MSIERNYALNEVLIVLDGCKNTKMISSFLFSYLCFSGPHLTFSGRVVPVVLESFVGDSQLTLPPVNWASVLSSLMRCTFGESIRYC